MLGLEAERKGDLQAARLNYKFALDMANSPLLIPVGGEIPEPEPIEQEPPPQMREYDMRWDA